MPNIKKVLRTSSFALSFALLNIAGARLNATVTVSVTTSVQSPQPLGSSVKLTATGTDTHTGPLTYKFEVTKPGSPDYTTLQDFSLLASFTWVPTFSEGTYQLRTTARDFLSGETSQQIISFTTNSLLVGGAAAVNPTSHPLVALFSAPTCATGSQIRISLQKNGASTATYTDWRNCHARSQNFLIGGMAASTTYAMNYQVMTGSGSVTKGPTPLSFTTGAIPKSLKIPAVSQPTPYSGTTDLTDYIVLTGFVPVPGQPIAGPLATDLQGTTLWYYSQGTQLTRPVAGGTMLMITSGLGTGTGFYGNITVQQLLREVDLAGNIIHQVTSDRVSEQLQAMGTDPLDRFTHDAIRLPNGYTMVIGEIQRSFPAGTQGSTGPVDIIGDEVIALDESWQVVAYWNTFDHDGGGTQLDINRKAVEGTICKTTIQGCPPALLPGFTQANDWVHGNAIQYLSDSTLLLSLRSQNWVIKIDFNGENGQGTGNLLWRLGAQGDFTLEGSTDPYPWFSGQHEPGFEDTAMTTLSVFDNSSTRDLLYPGSHSRGQVYIMDYTDMTVTQSLSVDLGVFSQTLGSAQLLVNGDYMFQPGYIYQGTSIYEQSIELNSSGDVTYEFQGQDPSYRSWRMPDMYHPPSS